MPGGSRDSRMARRQKKNRSGLNRTSSQSKDPHNYSYEVGKVSAKALALIEKNKMQ